MIYLSICISWGYRPASFFNLIENTSPLELAEDLNVTDQEAVLQSLKEFEQKFTYCNENIMH